jgi:hypothetical protein
MLRRVALARAGVSEELSASIISVTRIGEVVTANIIGSPIVVTLVMEALSYSETSNIPEDGILHSHRRENLKSYMKTDSASKTLSFLICGILDNG